MKLCGFDVGLEHRFFLIAGPCVIESEQLQMDAAGTLKEITAALGIPFIFKSSFDKANRSSEAGFRGLGMDKGLEILAKVKRELNVPVLTDVHDTHHIAEVSKVVDVLQTPALLCRHTDPRRGHQRPAGEYQEGPVHRAARHEERAGQGP